MTGMQSLIARTMLGSAAAFACAALISSRSLLARSKKSFDTIVISGMIVSRLALYVLIFLLLRIAPRGDIPVGYAGQGFSALRGLLVYRDYYSSYAPLHSYMDGGMLRIWPSPLVIILFAVLVEFLILPLWLSIARAFTAEREVRFAALLYLLNPLSIQFVTVDGQDNVVIAVFLALAVRLLMRNRAVLSGVCAAMTVTFFKFLPQIYVPSFFLAAGRRRWNWIAALTVPIILVYGAFALMHAPVLLPLKTEGGLRKAGCLPYLVETLMGQMMPARLWDGIVIISLCIVVLVTARAMRTASKTTKLRVLTFSMSALTCTIVLLSKKSWPAYLMLALFPLCLVFSSGAAWRRFVFLFFSILAVVEHSFWSTLLGEITAPSLHEAILKSNPVALELLIM